MRSGLLSSFAGLWLLAASGAMAGDIALGQRLYREGILASGDPVVATTVKQNLRLSGAGAACSSCHRRSGFGSSEGYRPIRPITGRYLFQAVNAPNPRMFHSPVSSPGMRPAYSDTTLARALRDGIDTAGRPLDGMMPRYRLGDQDLDNLVAYLKTFSTAPAPGVTDTTLHFATVIDATAAPEHRQAMLDILEAFFRDKNAGTRLEGERAKRPPWDQAREYKAYRTWQLHVWTLDGPPATWPRQLDAYYRRQPVFAVLSGIGSGSWQPVHDFCEQTEVPCLFPNVDLPPQTPGQYALYFSRGLALEGEALAAHLASTHTAGPVLQVYRDDAGRAAADRFRNALAATDFTGGVEDRVVAPDVPLDAAFWRDLAGTRPAVVVLWLKQADLAALAALDPPPRQLHLSASLAGRPTLPASLAERTSLTYPYELPQRLEPRLQRLYAWLRMKHIPAQPGPIQANTFFAVSQAGEALMHLVDDYSRDYFIERIEHGMDNALAPSAYPRLSLGPDQRFASKGSYVVQAGHPQSSHLEPMGDWIVPDLLQPPAGQ